MVMQMNSNFLRGKDNVDEDYKRGNMCEIFLRLQEISSSVKCLTILVLLYNMISEEALSSIKRSHESNGNQSLYVGCHKDINIMKEQRNHYNHCSSYGRYLVLGGLVINIDESRHKLTSPVGGCSCGGDRPALHLVHKGQLGRLVL